MHFYKVNLQFRPSAGIYFIRRKIEWDINFTVEREDCIMNGARARFEFYLGQ